MVKIYGNGLMWIPTRGRAVQFENGVILTDDPDIIDCAKINGFQIEGELALPEIEAPKPKRKPKGVSDEPNS
jgi:hypothetical protein